jgi:signal transduction histidine kinase
MSSSVEISTGSSVVLVGSAITMRVVSNDQGLIALCRDVLRELAPNPGSLGLESQLKHDAGHTEICLWDYEPANLEFSEGFEGLRTFYLVLPSQVDSLLRTIPAAEGNVLMKPVTRAILQAFVGSVVPRGDCAKAEVGTLRANRDELLQRLLHANLRLQEYDQQRTNFIARAVHDFRAPLTALSGFCGLLATGQLGPLNHQQKEALQRMEHSAKRITRMASAMFDLSVGPKLNRKPDLQEGDICERVKQALHEILPFAREKQISLYADDLLPSTRPLYFEPAQIEQVLLNLLDNACKFTHREGSIEVLGYPYFWERRFLAGGSAPGERRRTENGRVPNSYRIDIRDTGPGIPPDRLSHIFEEYTSYSGPQDRTGGGLGLAICRLIMSRHEGHIWADSHSNGATFSFVLPYRLAEFEGSIPRAVRV